jgi:hypothetical protein
LEILKSVKYSSLIYKNVNFAAKKFYDFFDLNPGEDVANDCWKHIQDPDSNWEP